MEYFILIALASGALGAYVADQKNRSLIEGAVLGFLFSLIGVLVVALLPSKEENQVVQLDSKMKLLDLIGYFFLFILSMGLIFVAVEYFS